MQAIRCVSAPIINNCVHSLLSLWVSQANCASLMMCCWLHRKILFISAQHLCCAENGISRKNLDIMVFVKQVIFYFWHLMFELRHSACSNHRIVKVYHGHQTMFAHKLHGLMESWSCTCICQLRHNIVQSPRCCYEKSLSPHGFLVSKFSSVPMDPRSSTSKCKEVQLLFDAVTKNLCYTSSWGLGQGTPTCIVCVHAEILVPSSTVTLTHVQDKAFCWWVVPDDKFHTSIYV